MSTCWGRCSMSLTGTKTSQSALMSWIWCWRNWRYQWLLAWLSQCWWNWTKTAQGSSSTKSSRSSFSSTHTPFDQCERNLIFTYKYHGDDAFHWASLGNMKFCFLWGCSSGTKLSAAGSLGSLLTKEYCVGGVYKLFQAQQINIVWGLWTTYFVFYLFHILGRVHKVLSCFVLKIYDFWVDREKPAGEL